MTKFKVRSWVAKVGESEPRQHYSVVADDGESRFVKVRPEGARGRQSVQMVDRDEFESVEHEARPQSRQTRYRC